MTWVWLLAYRLVLVMWGRFGSATLLSLLRDPAHHVAKSGRLLPSQSWRPVRSWPWLSPAGRRTGRRSRRHPPRQLPQRESSSGAPGCRRSRLRRRALNRVDTELETHIPTATGATHTVARTAPAHRITITGHDHEPAQTSAPGPDSNRKASPKSESVPGLVELRGAADRRAALCTACRAGRSFPTLIRPERGSGSVGTGSARNTGGSALSGTSRATCGERRCSRRGPAAAGGCGGTLPRCASRDVLTGLPTLQG